MLHRGSWLKMAGFMAKVSTKWLILGHPYNLKLTREGQQPLEAVSNEHFVTHITNINYSLVHGKCGKEVERKNSKSPFEKLD